MPLSHKMNFEFKIINHKAGEARIIEVIPLFKQIEMGDIPGITAKFKEFIDEKPKMILINLQDIKYLDSSALGMLFQFQQKMKPFNGRLALCCVNKTIQLVLNLTKSDKLIKIFEKPSDALASVDL